jgi:hypothetical protein
MKILLKKDVSSIPKRIKPIKELWTQELTIDYLQKLVDYYAQEAMGDRSKENRRSSIY